MHLRVTMACLHTHNLKEADRQIKLVYEKLLSCNAYDKEIEANSDYQKRMGRTLEYFTYFRNYLLIQSIHFLILRTSSSLYVSNLDEAGVLLGDAIKRLNYAAAIYQDALNNDLGKTQPYISYPDALKDLDFRLREVQVKYNCDRAANRILSNIVNFNANQVAMGLDRDRSRVDTNNPNASALRRFGKFSLVIARPKREEQGSLELSLPY
ncbi:hypothetical protein BN59_01218 [Legionella massiliensis]|uniref:Uncharacterized protein n=2 Tax=Legionella massiliensis TaxID=1034943 RepID=A0A078KYW1_9GAMM|nr:hypothetical protein BN59_01218 [Legionella massiliensis]CEE12677.1 hypothetical protein BN1094_01218 [Legionella massiliensis]